MSLAEMHVMAEFRHGRPRDRLIAFLCSIYGYGGDNRDKRLARDLSIASGRDVTARTARNLFEGHWPGDETWAAIVRRFGDTVLRVVFDPEIAPVLAEIAEREARLDRELQALRARRREVQGPVGVHPDRREGSAGEAAAVGPANLDLFEEGQP
jgi:hypothetical protein